ncbi:MAG: hypothetical protein GF383_02115 [Candidatus Lokiarchaeota archaeon]|nr:hypothetical protein [Candidatus Lokiarchaeota archaeon]MBD3338209.1 hypothetical protein [Candidatus Lokiarchaeota archaeon]
MNIKDGVDELENHTSLKNIEQITIKISEQIAESGDYFESAEFIYSAAELIETLKPEIALNLYQYDIELWEKLISDLTMQARLHEIAEVHLKLAEIYGKKLGKHDLEKEHILHSINFLKQEIDLIVGFSETNNLESRKLAQNYQNIAELYVKARKLDDAIEYYVKVIEIAKLFNYFDILSYSYQQIAYCYKQLDDYSQSKEILLDAVEYFSNSYQEYESKNENLLLSQTSQILKKLYRLLDNHDQYINYAKKEASAYINLAKSLEKTPENYQKISRYYRGAALCYKEIQNNLIEAASCFVLAGTYSEKIEDFHSAGMNFFDAATEFKEIKNHEMSYKNFIKAGDNFTKVEDVNRSTESYLNAYDVVIEGNLNFNRFGIFDLIVQGLNSMAEEGLKNKQFYTAATLILESIKFYQQLDFAEDILLREMVNNVYKYYYKAAHLKKISYSHIVHSYVLASISSILNGRLKLAKHIISEVNGSKGRTMKKYRELIDIIIKMVREGKAREITLQSFPYPIQKIIQGSEEIMYLINLFKIFP